jgi:DNA-binding MarR family transcriptional regulator
MCQKFLLTIVVVRSIYTLAMVRRLRTEIKQTKSFESLEEEVFLNLQRTADALMHGIEAVLKPVGLSPSQYNVLRILRGAVAEGLACREVAERMVTRDPDITRLLDRLEARGLVMRSRDRDDRRVITVRITPEGLRLLQELDTPVGEIPQRQLGHLGAQRLHALIELLQVARERAG